MELAIVITSFVTYAVIPVVLINRNVETMLEITSIQSDYQNDEKFWKMGSRQVLRQRQHLPTAELTARQKKRKMP